MGTPIGAGVSRTALTSDDFQTVLLELSTAASHGLDFEEMVRLFCRGARRHFDVSSVFCWLLSGRELIGLDGDGTSVAALRGKHFSLDSNIYAARAIRENATVLVNDVMANPDDIALRFPIGSILCVPLVVHGSVNGCVVFAQNDRKNHFTEELDNKGHILASMLGNLVDAARLMRSSREERRRAEALIQCAKALHANLDVNSVCHELTRSVCEMLRAKAVVLLVTQDDSFRLASIYAPEQAAVTEMLHHHSHGVCRPARELARKALAAGDTLALHLEQVEDASVAHGQVLAAPLISSASTCVLLAYPHDGREFDQQELSLLRAVSGFGAVAISNAELFTKSGAQANELQQLLAITSELSNTDDLNNFLERFVLRAGEFLGFSRAGIALIESDGRCYVRWAAADNETRPLLLEVPPRVQKVVIEGKKPLWSDDVTKIPDADLEYAERFDIKQALAVPLLGSQGQSLGVLAVLDRKDGQPIDKQDVARAEALAAGAATVLERTRNLHLALQHQQRSENLVKLALEIGATIRLPELAKTLTDRAAEMFGARSASLLLSRGSLIESVYVMGGPDLEDTSLARRLNLGVAECLLRHSGEISTGKAADLIGAGVAGAMHWTDLVVARMTSADNELIGVLCLANLSREITEDDRSLLQAVLAHGSVALDNSRLFMRIAQANNEWNEIFDAISDFIIVHDQNDQVLRINRSMAEFLGARSPDLIGTSMRVLMSLAQESNSEACPFCRNHEQARDEYVHPVLDRTYLVSTSRLHANEHERQQTIHVLKDITDRREAEQRYRELFDNIQEGLFFSTPEGRFIEVNDALVRMLGYGSREELLLVDIHSSLYSKPDERRRFQDAVEQGGALRNFEETLLRKDGSRIHTLQNAIAVRDARGKVVQYRGLMLDITDLKTFQVELQRQRDFNASILNNTQSLIVVVDTAGLVSFANRRCYEIGGFASGELVGRPLVEFVAPERRDAFRGAFERTLEGEQVTNIELPLLLVQHSVGQFSMNLSPVRNEHGQVNSIVVIMTDITDAAILQAKLMHTEKMAAVGQLVSGVAHEVNNPLTAILGFADLLSCQEGISDAAKRDLGVIIQEAQRTKQIVQNLLSFARQMPPQRQPLQINQILQRTVQLRAYDFANHGIKLIEDLAANLPDVVGDPHQLQQVFLNIINNAYDAIRETEKPGEITVRSAVEESCAIITFMDTGPGITAPDRIFDPFFTTKEVGKGTGLGLSICYGIVREHGGEISCTNRTDTNGAVFSVKLPLAGVEQAAAAGKEA